MPTNLLHLVSGPPGAGKTTVLQRLRGDFEIVPEAARCVLSQQRATGGRGTGDQDPSRFVSLMLETALSDHDRALKAASTVLFDRGLPDLLAYAAYYELCTTKIRSAVENRRYVQRVFWFPAWEAIYETDDERKMTFVEAQAFGNRIREGFLTHGYELLEMPLASVDARAAFIKQAID